MKEVFFVRHAESESNADGIHRHREALLTEKGYGQAQIVADRIAKIGVDALISTSFPRARSTAEAISQKTELAIEESDLFIERKRPSMSVGRRHHDEDVQEVMNEIFEGYLLDNHRHSDEENFEDLRTRANKALQFLIDHSSNRICVVTHGIFLRIMFTAAVNGPEFTGRDMQNAFKGLETGNTGIFYFRYASSPWFNKESKLWQVVSWNDSAHFG